MKKIIAIILIFALVTPIFSMNPQQDQNDEAVLNLLLEGVWNNLDELEASWERLNNRVQSADATNNELRRLVNESGIIIEQLKKELASATEGINDSIEVWWHMETLLDEMRTDVARWEKDYNILQKKAKMGNVNFILGAGTGAGLVYGFSNLDNTTAMGIGFGTSGVCLITWLAGKFIFKWW
jgi:hypothetical protein